MDSNLFKKTYQYVCDSCGEFTHTLTEFCEKCGEKSLRKAKKDDYKKLNHPKQTILVYTEKGASFMKF